MSRRTFAAVGLTPVSHHEGGCRLHVQHGSCPYRQRREARGTHRVLPGTPSRLTHVTLRITIGP